MFGEDLTRTRRTSEESMSNTARDLFIVGLRNAHAIAPLGDSSRIVATQRGDEHSLLRLYRRLIEVRRQEPALVAGDYDPLRAPNDVLCYARFFGERRLLIGLNIADEPRRWEFETQAMPPFSTCPYHKMEAVEGSVLLKADEGPLLVTNVAGFESVQSSSRKTAP